VAETPPTGGFLPPEPSGPEPDLGGRPQPAAPAHQGYAPPAQAAPSQAAPAQPASPQAPAWTAPAQPAPDNGPAVLGFCLSASSLGLLLTSVGLSSLVSVGLAIPGVLQSRKGSRRVQAGETTRNAGLATAGFVVGLIALVLSVLATIFWILIAVIVATDDDARREFEREFDRQYERSSVGVLLVAARIAGAALS
jgi:hypothetical protein